MPELESLTIGEKIDALGRKIDALSAAGVNAPAAASVISPVQSAPAALNSVPAGVPNVSSSMESIDPAYSHSGKRFLRLMSIVLIIILLLAGLLASLTFGGLLPNTPTKKAVNELNQKVQTISTQVQGLNDQVQGVSIASPVPGAKGAAGAAGANGSKGAAGVAGTKGAAGLSGLQGPAGSGSSVDLQGAYNNSSTPASIVTSSSSKGLVIQAGPSADSSNLFSIQNSSGAPILSVDSAQNQITVDDLLPKTIGTYTAASGGTADAGVLDGSSGAGNYGTYVLTGPDGFARAVYTNYGNGTLNYTRCTDIDCSTNVPTIVKSGLDDPYGVSAVLGSDGFARIVYYDYANNGVNYVRCTNADCTTSNSAVIESGDDQGDYGADIKIGSNGFPVIAYNGGTDDLIHLAVCNDDDCSSPTINTFGSFYGYDSYQWQGLAIGPDGFPRVAAMSFSDTYLHYYRCTDADCTSPVDTIVDSTTYYPGSNGLKLQMGQDGFPKIAYEDYYATLHYADCTDQDCLSPAITTIASSYYDYGGLGFAIDSNGNPNFVYSDSTGSQLLYAVCSDPGCDSISSQLVDTIAYPSYYGESLSLNGNGDIYIDYSDYDSGHLHFASIEPLIPASFSGTGIGRANAPFGSIYVQDANVNSLNPITAGTTHNGIFSEELDNGSYAGYYGTSIAVGSDNFARIAYSEDEGVGKFARCTNTDCTSPITTTYDSADTADQSIAMGSDGFARIAYYSYDSGGLRLARCTDANCSSPVLTDVDPDVSNDNPAYDGTAIAIGQDGFPRILEANSTNPEGTLVYIDCTDADCTTKNVQNLGNFEPSVNDAFGLTLGADGFARIIYNPPGTDALTMLRCLNDACSSSNTDVIDSTSDNPGDYGASIVMGSDGFPDIAYLVEDSNPPLDYVKCTDADCTSPQITTITDAGEFGQMGISMTLNAAGNPVIAYADTSATNGSLFAAICSNPTCGSTSLLQIDPTEYAIYYGVGVASGSDGLPQFAYADGGSDDVLHYGRCLTSNCQSQHVTGSNIGSSTASFGQGYLQELTLQDSSGGAILTANQQGSGDILDMQSNGTDVLTVNSVGGVTLQPAGGAAYALRIMDSGTQVLTIGSNGSIVTNSLITAAGNIQGASITATTALVSGTIILSGSSNGIYIEGSNQDIRFRDGGLGTPQAITHQFSCNGSITAGDVVVIDVSNGADVNDTSTANSALVAGIATSSCVNGNTIDVAVSGIYHVNVDSGAVSVGNLLTTSTTSGDATVGAAAVGDVLGKALSSKSGGSPGTIWLLLSLQ